MKFFDLIILGGGINGCALARDASLRGLSVLLLEKGDLGSGTSGGSSKLIHGGLRYLPQGHLGLVREALRERSLLLKNAGGLVRPLKFIFPLRKDSALPSWALRTGLWIYDRLAPAGPCRGHGWLSAAELENEERALSAARLKGAGWYWDAATDDARLCLENALDAKTHGAEIRTWTEALSLVEGPGSVTLRFRDVLSGRESEAEAPLLYSGLGPFFPGAVEGLQAPEGLALAPSRGSHLVIKGELVKCAAVLPSPDGRIIFLIPWGGWTLLGTTDAPHQGDPGLARLSKEEADYLLALASGFLKEPRNLRDKVVSSYAAIRPLLKDSGDSLHKVSREHKLFKKGRILFLAGGKLTTYRSIAEEACDEICRNLGRKFPACATAKLPLPRRILEGSDDILAWVYGSATAELRAMMDKEPELAKPLWEGPRPWAGTPVLKAEVPFSAREEVVRRLEDFMIRRSRLAFTPGGGEKEAEAAALLLAPVLGWDRARIREEMDSYLSLRAERLGPPLR